MNGIKGVTIALSVSALFAATGCGASDDMAKGQGEKLTCEGGNSCAGHSECASEGASSCKGMNSCKGMGWVYTDTKAECTELQETNKAS